MQEHRCPSPWHSCVADSSGQNNSPLALIHRLDGRAPHSSGFGRLCSNQAEMILRVLLPSSIFQFLEGPRTIYYLPERGRTVDRQRSRSMVIQQMPPDLISAFLFLLGFPQVLLHTMEPHLLRLPEYTPKLRLVLEKIWDCFDLLYRSMPAFQSNILVFCPEPIVFTRKKLVIWLLDICSLYLGLAYPCVIQAYSLLGGSRN
ncbi:putative AC9 transposase [Fusarium oxysporum f. sp. albedinis]|nr:putative AC9 transposase [Fusarium oxysporum f. sp. albedinis]